MGPTNIALVKLFQADQALRGGQKRLEAASRNIRLQERRVKDLGERLQAAQTSLREQQSHSAQLDLDLKSRDSHIDRLRQQQQTAKNNKEYQAFLVQINTEKVDRNKVEDLLLQGMESIEKHQTEVQELGKLLEAERTKLETMGQEIGDKLAALQAEIATLQPKRDEAAAAVSPKAREAFERILERWDGEAMSAIAKPDRRHEEYICTGCNMSLVVDVYNRLHSRDELVFCPSCQRILYIPADLPPEMAINSKTGKKNGKGKKDDDSDDDDDDNE